MVIVTMVFFRQRKISLFQGHGQNPKTACGPAHYHKADQGWATGASAPRKIQLREEFLLRGRPGIPAGCVRFPSNESCLLSPFLFVCLSLSLVLFSLENSEESIGNAGYAVTNLTQQEEAKISLLLIRIPSDSSLPTIGGKITLCLDKRNPLSYL